MTSVICDPDRIADREAVTVECAAPDDELLLVDWLNALIYEMATRRRCFRDSTSASRTTIWLFSRFDVGITNHHLAATAWGEPIDISRHNPAAEVKGNPRGLAHLNFFALMFHGAGVWLEYAL